MKQGIFISLEGIDGAGKSTHIEYIQSYLESKGIKVIITREPGGTLIGEKIRDLLLTSETMHDITELLLYFASRQEIISQVIIPNLKAGNCVIADRFIDASIAYQGGGRRLGIDKVQQVYSMLEPKLITDITFLFDVPLDIAMERVRRSRTLDRIELESQEFFMRVQYTYHELAAANPDRIKTIMTNGPHEETRKIISRHLDTLFKKKL